MNFSNKKVLKTFTSPHSKNAWANIQTIGWKKVDMLTSDGVTNTFILLCAAKANNKPVTGTIDNDKITIVYL